MIINILWIICCLPIVTSGASTAALYFVLFSRENDNGRLVRTFFSSFRNNIKSSLPIMAIMFLPALAATTAYMLLLITSGNLNNTVQIMLIIVIILFTFVHSYIWPIHALFNNKPFNNFKHALLLSLAHLPSSVLVALLHLTPFIWLFWGTESFLKASFVWLLLGCSSIAWLCVKILRPIFQLYLSEEIINL